MRSLYTEDIEGTKPRLTIFEKGYYRTQLESSRNRSLRPTNKNYIPQWYQPVPKGQRASYQYQPYRNTIKLISEHTGLSQSMHYQNLKKSNDISSLAETDRRYSLLGRSGVSMLAQSRPVMNSQADPYYPHKIRGAYDQSNSNKFTGKRDWNYTPSPQINLPDPKSEYVSRWNKI